MNRTSGTYWRLAWSTDWYKRNPWCLNSKHIPYIGVAKDRMTTVRTLGPLALISFKI